MLLYIYEVVTSMNITFNMVKERLIKHMDEIELLELLQLTNDRIIEAFETDLEDVWLSGRLDSWIKDEFTTEEDENDDRGQ